MFIFTLYQVCKFALQGFWRNFWLSVVTISVIVLVFFSVNFLVIINKISETLLAAMHEKVDISIYFKAATKDEAIATAENELQSISQIKTVEIISRQEALASFRKKHKDNTNILKALEELDENPLGPTMRVKAKDIHDYDEIMGLIENAKFSSDVASKSFDNNKQMIDKINIMSGYVNKFGLIVTFIFLFISILIVFNTIKLAIYTHEKEIAIMKLVGASNSFISLPYIIESILYALVATAVSILMFLPLLAFIQPYIDIFFRGFEGGSLQVSSYFQENFLVIFGPELLGIILLNIIASGLAMRRYLRV